jgi:two-component system, OmpR family, response regulator
MLKNTEKNIEKNTEANRTVLVVEDEKAIRYMVRVALEKINYNVIEASSAKELFETLETQDVDLILLDLFLDDDHGIDICKKVRVKTSAPVIVISSMSGELNQVMGLDAGADMYLEKPFSIPVLLANMHALFRRIRLDEVNYQNISDNKKSDQKSGKKSDQKSDQKLDQELFSTHAEEHLSCRSDLVAREDENYTVKLGNWLFIPYLSCLKSDAGRTVKLTKKELSLLQLFIQHHNQILTRYDVSRALKLDLSSDNSRVVDVQVSRLRSKLKDRNNNNLIKSIRNKGYILNGSVRVRF